MRTPNTESNSEKFRILATKRMPKALKALDLVGNLANTSNYSYTKAQARQIQRVLKDKVNEVCSRFDMATSKGGDSFTLVDE
jgi:hypothetical protein